MQLGHHGDAIAAPACSSHRESTQSVTRENVLTMAFAAALAAFVGSMQPLSAMPDSDANRAAGTELTQSLPGPRRPTVCIEQYAPVCGRIGNVTRTFSNACFAHAAGAEVVAQGPCVRTNDRRL